ncbi:MAG: hypothetical protein WCT99_05610 [Bacteroidota bacterium]|jgi:hypothetical protein
MKCSYCQNEIPDGSGVRQGDFYFCNTVHRYAWKAKNTAIISAAQNLTLPESVQSSRMNIGKYSLLGVGIVLIVAGIYFFTLSGRDVSSAAGGDPASIELQWEAFVKQINDNCPVKFDEEIQLQNVSLLPDKILLYNYKLTNVTGNKIDEMQLRNYFRPKFIELIRTRGDLQTFRENSFTFVSKFRNKKGVVVTEISIANEDYLD